jgi:hypothetical protein
MLHRVWNYISNNALISGFVLLSISSVGWASLAKSTSHWFWAVAGISRGGVLIWALVTLASVVVIYKLVVSLRAERRVMAREVVLQQSKSVATGRVPVAPPKVDASGLERTPLVFDALTLLLDRYGEWTGLYQLERELRQGMLYRASGTMPIAARAQVARVMDAAERAGVVRSDPIHGYQMTPHGRNWMLDEVEKGQKGRAWPTG